MPILAVSLLQTLHSISFSSGADRMLSILPSIIIRTAILFKAAMVTSRHSLSLEQINIALCYMLHLHCIIHLIPITDLLVYTMSPRLYNK